MYTKNVLAVAQTEDMLPSNNLARIRQLDAYKSARVVAELKIACNKYSYEELNGKVISFDYQHSPTIVEPTKCWCKVTDIFPLHSNREFVPKNAQNTSPKLHRRFL